MAAIPTVIYIGDDQISGGATSGLRTPVGTRFNVSLPATQEGGRYHVWRHNVKLNRVVPSGPDGLTGGTFQPYWDGTANAWVQFHVVPGAGTPTDTMVQPFLPLAYGDNWYEGSATSSAITPTPLLINKLWERWPGGFKLIKYASNAGFGGVNGFKDGGNAYNGTISEVTDAGNALGVGDTLDVKAIVIDCATTDLVNSNVTYKADAASFIDNIRGDLDALTRTTCGTTVPIVLVNHHPDMKPTGIVVEAIRIQRQLNRELAAEKANVHLFDMNWATDWQQGVLTAYAPPILINQPGVEPTDRRYYGTESYLLAGERLGRTLNGIWTAAPVASPGSAIPVVAMIGDSQFVGTVDAQFAVLSGQESLLGEAPGSERSGQYIWNNANGTLDLYDVVANANTFGTTGTTFFGPEATMLKRLAEEFPAGVVVWKYARNGVSLTTEANGAANAVEQTGSIWPTLTAAWSTFKAQCLSQLGRSPDLIGIVTDVGGNDGGTTAASTAFAAKCGTFVDDLRATFPTRATGGELPIVWLQPPPPVETGGNSQHNAGPGQGVRVNTVRSAIASLQTSKQKVGVVLNTGADKYELQRSDAVHYGGEANLQVGYDVAELLLDLLEDADSDGAAVGEQVFAGATFTVETGTGSTTANSYASTAFATTYHQTYGNPSAWSAASIAQQQDALRQATLALDVRYGSRWSGYRYSSDQALDWPRTYAVDSAGNTIDSDEIPVRLQQATAMLALLHVQGEDINPTTRTSADIRSETLSAASGASKSVTYAGAKPVETQFVRIERMLQTAGLIGGGGGWGWLDL